MNNLTTEQIARVFAMYLGQRITCPGRPFHANRNSLNEQGRAILSPSILADCHEHTFSYTDFKIHLRPLSAISDEELTTLVSIFLGKMPQVANIRRSDDGSYITFEYNREADIRDPNTEVSMCITINCDTGSIRNTWMYISGSGTGVSSEPLNNSGLIDQYLTQQGYAVPLYHGPNHPENGRTAIESGLAIDSTLNP